QAADSSGAGHWYAWDLDWCSLGMVVAAGAYPAAAEALAEWRDAVGDAAAAAELAPCPPDMVVRLLPPPLARGPIWEGPLGGEPLELMREYFRLDQRANVLAAELMGRLPEEADGEDEAGAEDAAEAFLAWYAEREGADGGDQVADAVEAIIAEWGSLWL